MTEQVLRKATVIKNDAAKLLDHEHIDVGSTIMAPKRDVGEKCGGGRVVLETNCYGLLMKAVAIYRYDVAIYGTTRSGRVVELAKKVSGDALYVDRRANCREIVTAFKEQFSNFIKVGAGNCLYYDLQSILYSLLPLDVNPETGVAFTVEVESLRVYFERIQVNLKCVSGGVITLGDLSVVSSDVGNLDKTLEQFLNIATSQHMMFNKDEFVTFSSSHGFMLNPEAHGFRPDDCPAFEDNGSYLAIGVQKGIRYVEGPRSGSRNAALVVEVKRTPFQNIESAVTKANRFVGDVCNCQNGAVDRLNFMFKGLQMETMYGRTQKFVVTGVCCDTAQDKRIMIGEGTAAYEITVQQYFLDKYNITLRYPTAPLLEARGHGCQTNFYPIELCVVSDNQRVRSHQQTPKQVQEMIKKCAVSPVMLREQSKLVTNSLRLTDNEFLKAAGIHFIKSPLKLNARILSPPSLQYSGNNISQVNTESFTWDGRHFLVPANVRVWAAYAFNGGIRDSISDVDFFAFIDRYLQEARNCGIQIPDPADVRRPRFDPDVLNSELRLASQNGVEFVLVAHPDGAIDMHAALKLCERNYSIITQGLKIGTVRSVITKGQNLTVQNIINKTNLKLGGLNYSLALTEEFAHEVIGSNSLFIGFGMAHPASGFSLEKENGNGSGNGNGNGNGSEHGNVSSTENSDLIDKPPSVCGYSANIGNNAFEFYGDFLFREFRRDEKVSLIQHVVKRCIKTYRVNQRKDPRRIFIYRNGCSEGQFAGILQYEIPLVKNAIEQLSCSAKVTLIVCNKLQNMRFFNTNIDPRARPTEQNIRPGTVVDNCVVHPFYCEFFLNPHRALQGTARTPKFTILYDDNNLTMDQIQGITYHLCYAHQIVSSPTSLPSPVYIAMLYAERGQMLYRRYKTVTSSDYEPRRYSEMTDRLGYENVPLFANRRINA